jgi:hypothetical protein
MHSYNHDGQKACCANRRAALTQAKNVIRSCGPPARGRGICSCVSAALWLADMYNLLFAFSFHSKLACASAPALLRRSVPRLRQRRSLIGKTGFSALIIVVIMHLRAALGSARLASMQVGPEIPLETSLKWLSKSSQLTNKNSRAILTAQGADRHRFQQYHPLLSNLTSPSCGRLPHSCTDQSDPECAYLLQALD